MAEILKKISLVDISKLTDLLIMIASRMFKASMLLYWGNLKVSYFLLVSPNLQKDQAMKLLSGFLP